MSSDNHVLRDMVLKDVSPLKAGECVAWPMPDDVKPEKFIADVRSRVAWYYREGFFGRCRVEGKKAGRTVTIWNEEED